MNDAKGLSEYKCTCHCGGEMFYAYLHAADCPLSVHGEKAPLTQEETLRAENAALVERLKEQWDKTNTEYVRVSKACSRLTADLAQARAALERYRVAMDKIYNHNEATRAAVIQYFGTLQRA